MFTKIDKLDIFRYFWIVADQAVGNLGEIVTMVPILFLKTELIKPPCFSSDVLIIPEIYTNAEGYISCRAIDRLDFF